MMAKETETTTEKSIQKNPYTIRESKIKEHITNWGNLSLWQKFTNLFRGRIGRKHYVIGLLFASALFISIGFVLGLLLSLVGLLEALLGWALLLIYIVFILSLHIRRLHDLGASGWRVLLFFIPIVNFLFFLWLLFFSGEKGENEYGKRPEKAGLFDLLLNRF